MVMLFIDGRVIKKYCTFQGLREIWIDGSIRIIRFQDAIILLGIDPDFYKNKDIHIHFPEGAVPKDGPSAGITVTIALISALAGTPVRHDVAMTGEITLRGRVLPIGGLREKTMAAFRSGIHTVIIPEDNVSDLAEIDQTVRQNLHFVSTDHVDKILDVAFAHRLRKKKPTKSAKSGSRSAELRQ